MVSRQTMKVRVWVLLFLSICFVSDGADLCNQVHADDQRLPPVFGERIRLALITTNANNLVWPLLKQNENSWSAWIWGLPKKLADRLRAAAGGGRRGGELPVNKLTVQPNNTAIWTAAMPSVSRQIEENSLNLSIKSAMMPNWSPEGVMIVCRAWLATQNRWVIAAYRAQPTGLFQGPLWVWPPASKGEDFSPVWAPSEVGRFVAFVRQDQNSKTDIYVLSLDPATGQPQTEQQVTSRGNVKQIVGWDTQLGILLTTTENLQTLKPVELLWALKSKVSPFDPTKLTEPEALCVPSVSLQGRAPARNSLVVEERKPGVGDNIPDFHLREYTFEGEMQQLFRSSANSDHWPSVSPNGQRLAFDSNRPFTP